MVRECFFRVFYVVMVAQRVTTTNASPDPQLPKPPHISASVLIDHLLCDQPFWKGYETENAAEAARVALLMDLCAGKVNRSSPDLEPRVGIKLKRGTERVKSLFTKKDQKMMLDMHNELRRRVKPPAANMKLMKWDEYLADTAQMWSDQCNFVHGFPQEVMDKGEAIGQNLYMGTDSTGIRAMTMWFDEHEYYDFESGDCKAGEQCGHYVQLVWAESEYVGCGVARCVSKGYMITCHYKPPGNAKGVAPYLVGKACSQCQSKRDGGLCYKKACATKSECKELNITCSCNLECHNCATLNTKYCRCVCKKGWDSLDCSKPCADEHPLCQKNPGWPDSFSCSLMEGKVRDLYCRKMCRQCVTVDSKRITDSRYHCCEGKMCDAGYVLNSDCQCDPLCPGPGCLDHESIEDKQVEDEAPPSPNLPQR